MDEGEFILSIDFRFPYFDESRWRFLVETGARLSPNAAFMVLHELCRPSTSEVTAVQLQTIYEYWRACFAHPLVSVLSPVAEAMIRNEKLSTSEALQIMRLVAPYPHQYNALAIVRYSCDDPDEEASKLYDEIVAAWSRAYPAA